MTAPPPRTSGLRVGLTGGLGSGKTTAANMFARRGAVVFSADQLARSLMQPGQAVFAAIVRHFGPSVLRPDGTLDRPALARLAFAGGRVEELNALIHPATIALQNQLAREAFDRDPNAIVLVESALIFETRHGAATEQNSGSEESPGWSKRFDSLILVTAPESQKIARFVARSGAGDPQASEALAEEARRRLAQLIPDAEKAPLCEFILRNDGSLDFLEQQVEAVWNALHRRQASSRS